MENTSNEILIEYQEITMDQIVNFNLQNDKKKKSHFRRDIKVVDYSKTLKGGGNSL